MDFFRIHIDLSRLRVKIKPAAVRLLRDRLVRAAFHVDLYDGLLEVIDRGELLLQRGIICIQSGLFIAAGFVQVDLRLPVLDRFYDRSPGFLHIESIPVICFLEDVVPLFRALDVCIFRGADVIAGHAVQPVDSAQQFLFIKYSASVAPYFRVFIRSQRPQNEHLAVNHLLESRRHGQ